MSNIKSLPVDWGLRVGDIAANYRSALDHIAWAIVKRGRTPTLTRQEAGRIYFPLANSRAVFNGSLATKLPGARRADIAIVRRYQPYTIGESRARRDPLAILARLNNDDKHRQVQPVLAMPLAVDYEVTHQRDCVVTRWSGGQSMPLKIGAEVCAARVRTTGPNPELEVEASFTAQVFIYEGVIATKWLSLTWETIGHCLREFAYPPPLREISSFVEALYAHDTDPSAGEIVLPHRYNWQ